MVMMMLASSSLKAVSIEELWLISRASFGQLTSDRHQLEVSVIAGPLHADPEHASQES